MIYKILFIVGLVYIGRLILRNLSRMEQIKQQQKKSKKSHDDALDAEYRVVDEEEQK